MASKLLRSSAVVIVMAMTFAGSFFLLLWLSGTADGQVKTVVKGGGPPAAKDKGKGKGGPGNPDDPNAIGEFGSVTLPTDPKTKGKIEAARDYIENKDWPRAIHLLQGLLELKEDVVVPVVRKLDDGHELVNWVSVKVEANRLIGSLPKEGMEFYRLRNDQKAAELLKQAKETSDERVLAEVAASYLHTTAGAEATELLGTRKLDRGHYIEAGRYFKLLINREGIEKVSPLTLFKAKIAFTRGGDKASAEQVTQQLQARVPEGLRLGDRSLSLQELNEVVAKFSDPLLSRATIYDWHLGLGGRADRNAQGVGGHPFLEKAWHQVLFANDNYDDKTSRSHAAAWIAEALKQANELKMAAIPAFHPIAATADDPSRGLTQFIVFRSHWGVHAADIKTGRLLWTQDLKWGLDTMFSDQRGMQAIMQWEQQYSQIGRLNIVLENSIIGSLSTDGQRIFCVDDFAVPPYVQHFFNAWGGGGQQFPWGQEVNDALNYNMLNAFDLGSGKALWELGGHGDKFRSNDPKGELHDSYFLGPPLSLGGKLYALTDKGQELRLVCLDAAKGSVVWVQTLATTKEKMLMDVVRRANAAPLAYGEGILVCPTNAGAVIGVDLLTHSLLWAYAYRDKPPAPPQDEQQMQMKMRGRFAMNGEMQAQSAGSPTDWKSSTPIIADGKVVFTAPDGNTIDCLDLTNGQKVWRTNKLDGDLYLAGVYNGLALIIGKERCRALDLKDGGQVWTHETGMPSGRGVASDNIYYLPLRTTHTAPQSDPEPGVLAIDMNRGAIQSFTRSRKKEVPGNLLFYEGKMLSQSATHVVAYPQLKIKEREIDELIAKNPNDPAGLTERGELRLDRGDHSGAVEDLRKALTQNPPADIAKKTRAKLYEAMTDLFREKFSDAEKYLSEYEAMCNVEAPAMGTPEEKQKAEEEQVRRKSTFLYLIAKGREGQNRLVEAFDYYQKFGAMAGNRDLVTVPDESSLKAPPDIWAQGRIAAMVAKATPEARLPLEQQIAKTWDDVRKANDTEKMRQFVTMFGSLFRAGREARLLLAERLMEDNGKNGLLDAERHLLLLRSQKEDMQLAGRAVESLARLWTRQGLLEDAAYLYRDVLAKEFAKVVIRDGKTGSDLYAELATDKRFLPYLDEPVGGSTMQGRIEAKIERDQKYQTNQMNFGFEPEGEILPFFMRHKVALNYGQNQFKLIDRATNEDRWTETVPQTHFQNFLYVWTGGQQPHTPRYRYRMVGHIIVLPVAEMAFGLDPVNKKLLWKVPLLGADANKLNQGNYSVLPDPSDDGLIITYTYPGGHSRKLGHTGPVGATYVCLLTDTGLVTIDPVTGRTLWTRSDVSPRCQMFGDEQYIYLVEVGKDGSMGGSRAFRAADGVSVRVPEFASLFQKRIRTIGRNILLSDATDKALTMRLYDVHTGQDIWKHEFKGHSIPLKSEEAHLAGAVEPDGKVTVIDLNTRKEVLKGALDPKHLAKAQYVHLLADAQNYYLAINLPSDAANSPNGIPLSGLMPGSGMRSIPVNGYFYALHKSTGKVHWVSAGELREQMLVLEHFHEMPVVMFTARHGADGNNAGAFVGRGRNMNQMSTSFLSIDKRTGKRVCDPDEFPNNMMFYALNMDLRQGKIELLGQGLKITHILPNSVAAAAAKDKPASQPNTPTSGPVRRSVRPAAEPIPVQVEIRKE